MAKETRIFLLQGVPANMKYLGDGHISCDYITVSMFIIHQLATVQCTRYFEASTSTREYVKQHVLFTNTITPYVKMFNSYAA
jgi:hypothetical protein